MISEKEREIRSALRGVVTGQMEERIQLATGIILRAVGADASAAFAAALGISPLLLVAPDVAS